MKVTLVTHCRLCSFQVVALSNTLMHTLLLGCAYRACARYGVTRTLLLGLCAVLALCCLALLLWPLSGGASGSLEWRLMHVMSNSCAWVGGVWEFRTAHARLKTCNGLS